MMGRLDDLRSRRLVQDVPIDRGTIRLLLDDARMHLATASRAAEEGDLAGAYQLGYDAARKSLTAMLLSRGMRVRGPGAHVTILEAVRESFADEPGLERLKPFDRMRRTRNEAEYSGHRLDLDDVTHDLAIAAEIVALAESATREKP